MIKNGRVSLKRYNNLHTGRTFLVATAAPSAFCFFHFTAGYYFNINKKIKLQNQEEKAARGLLAKRINLDAVKLLRRGKGQRTYGRD